MSLSNPYAATVAMLFAAVSWGSLFLVGKPVLSRLDPIWFTALRYLLAGVGMMLLVVIFGERPWAKLRAHFGTLTRQGVLGYGFFGILVLEGLKLSLPSHGAVLMATMPMTTILLRWLLDGQRPGIAVAGAAVLALSGVVLVSGVLGRTDGPPHAAGRRADPAGHRRLGALHARRGPGAGAQPARIHRSHRPRGTAVAGGVRARRDGRRLDRRACLVRRDAGRAAPRLHRGRAHGRGGGGLQLRRAATRRVARHAVPERCAGVRAADERRAGPAPGDAGMDRSGARHRGPHLEHPIARLRR
ncbi:MAG: EamA family transporter [Rubrivivax sp.]|nr:MAG: EamA family transporter [Rubrivivax sp.]